MTDVYEEMRGKTKIYKPANEKNSRTGVYLADSELRKMQDEGRELRYKISRLENKIREQQADFKEKMKAEREKYLVSRDEDREELEAEYNRQLFEHIDESKQYKEAYEREHNLNRDLKRVATERANKARHMDKHDKGYLVMNWSQFTYKYHENGETLSFNLYKIVIQTPWDCSLSLMEIDALVVDAIKNGDIIISSKEFGYYKTGAYNKQINDVISDLIECNEVNENYIIARQYRSNVKEGLWEVTLIANFEPVIKSINREKYV